MATVQNHIHLATELGDSPENAPIYKWAALDRLPIPRVIMAMKDGMTGDLHVHRLLNSNGTTRRYLDLRYEVIVDEDDEYGGDTDERLEILLNMHGEFVYLVDHKHVADGEDHTPYVRQYFLAVVGEPKHIASDLNRFHVEIHLRDNRPAT